MGDSKGKPMSKMSRERELSIQLMTLRDQAKKDADAVTKDVEAKRKKALNDSLQRSRENGKVTEEQVAKCRRDLVAAKKKAEQEYEQELRRAQSSRDRALNDAEALFKVQQAEAEKILVEKNKPIEEEHQKTDAALVEEANSKLDLLQAAYEESVKPLADELRSIEEKKRERAEKQAAQDAGAR